jgi:protoheme IX farnesyltransferase
LAASLIKKFDIGLLLAFIIGTSLVIACGCVINNYIDREIDRNMARTKRRALVTGQIQPLPAIIYGTMLGLIGFWLLFTYTNNLTAWLGATGLFFYLVMYGFWKRRSHLGTVVGSVSGAIPIAAGYTAVTNRFDRAALLLFLTMVFWQMPHFYAIAMYRFKDYEKAGLPVLPVKKGLKRTKIEILAYVAAFTISATLLTAFGYTGYIFLVVILLIGLTWFVKGLRGFQAADDKKWGRRMFLFSLIVLLTLSAGLSVGALLP